MQMLDRVRNMPLGNPNNRLRFGDIEVAYSDNVLIVESARLTHMAGWVAPELFQIVVHDSYLVIDQWHESSSAIRIQATPGVLDTA